jgi:hypothetical protein
VCISVDPESSLKESLKAKGKPKPTDAPPRHDASPLPEPSPPSVPFSLLGCAIFGFLIVALIAMTVFGVAFFTEGVREMVTQTAVTHTKNDPTPIPLTGAMAVLNGAAFATLGGLFLIPCLLTIRGLWKKYRSKQAKRLDERNS